MGLYFLSSYNWHRLWGSSAIFFIQAMANSRKNREEFIGSQNEDHFVNLEWMRDREHNRTLSVRVETQHTKRTSRIQSSTRSHLSHEQETRNFKLEIDHLRKKLRHMAHFRGDPTPPSSLGSNDKGNHSYKPRSRTPPSESVSACSHLDIVEKHSRRQGESSSPRKMGNDAMSRSLRQISKSPFTRRIDRAKIPHRFT